MTRLPPRNDESPCVVLCNGHYSPVMGYAAANELAMQYAAKRRRVVVYRLIEETSYGRP